MERGREERGRGGRREEGEGAREGGEGERGGEGGGGKEGGREGGREEGGVGCIGRVGVVLWMVCVITENEISDTKRQVKLKHRFQENDRF